MRYNPALDGIRAVAILAVLVFHVSPTVLRGGFAGVDVFFVLSGFLITSIIIHDLRNRDFSFREFYLRRAQRLLPNMVAMVMGVLVLWALWMPPTSASQPGRHGMWALLNLSNIHIWRHLGGYWGDAAEQAPLTHTWSLAIEEQFYLLFPLTLFLLSRWMDERRVRLVLSLAAVVSFVACAIGTFIQPTATFYSLPTRSWELLLGSIIAISRKSDTPGGASFTEGGLRSGIEWAGCLGLALIGISFVVLDERSGFPGVVVLLPTIGTTLLIVAALDQGSKVARLLATPVLVEVGKMSYSVYLWHWPFIVFARFHMELRDYPRDVGAVFGGLAGTLIGCLAYFIVEQPLRSRGPGRMRRVAVIATGFVATLTACVLVANRMPVIDPLHRFDTPSFSGMSFDAGRPTIENLAKAVRYSDVVFAAPPLGLADAWRSGGIIHRFGGGNPAVVVLGSSHALMYSRLVDGICREKSVSVAFLGVDGNPAFFETVANQSFPSPKEAREFDAARRRWLREWRPSVVFVIDRWDI
ncbi:MAG TPA: acyltransferase family protein, partial [Bryobacteraceae bacterium]|nr:acyltransferase family protein [Bryobacteraceae bacterium]